ncbi:MAG: DUF4112 domain-containing protein [Burkholderiaceae bacterium]
MVTMAHGVRETAAERKQRIRDQLVTITRLMDSAFEVPGLKTRVGLDVVLGMVPVAGDLLSAAIGLTVVLQARELGASRWLQAKMIRNLVFDAALGAVPVAGDLADVYFRAHRRNLELLRKELGEPWLEADETPAPRTKRVR